MEQETHRVETPEQPQAPPAGPARELAALKKRMVDGAIGNFLCSGWHFYLGISILTTWRARHAGIGYVIVGFAVLQVLAGVWMLAAPGAGLFIADAAIYFFCAIMNILAAEMGAAGWIKFLGYFQIFLALDAIRRFRLFRNIGKRQAAGPVIVEGPPAAEAAPAPAEAPAAPEAAPAAPADAAAALADVLERPEAVKLAGSWQEGAFVLTKTQMSEVLARPMLFNNVLLATQARVAAGPESWILVLGEGAGIMMNKAGEHVFRFTRDGVTCGRGGARILTADGTKVGLGLDLNASIALWAWRSGSEEEFEKGADRLLRPTRWDLLAWSLEEGRRPEAWIGWRPSYGTREEGLRALCADEALLDKVLKKHKVTKAAKWITRAEPREAGILRSRLRATALRQAKRGLYLSAPLLAVGLALMVPVIVEAQHREIMASFGSMGALSIGATLTLAAVVSFFIGLHRKHLAARLLRESPAKDGERGES